ncbi:hypothetical protein [Streptomyces sp. NPDC090025]|uniref:hypothetical protein n=1 Tax=Streptomyces sp. NPDC090025 TaxID=3365922 RepID=UPI003838C108
MGKVISAGRAKRWSKLAAIPVGVLASGAMVLGATHATVQASAWNHGNEIGSGTWSKYDVTSDLGTDSVVKVEGVLPSENADGQFANVTYTFKNTAEDRAAEGQILLKDITAEGQSDVAKSDLAQHLHVGFGITGEKSAPGQAAPAPAQVKTLAEWYAEAAANKGRVQVVDGVTVMQGQDEEQMLQITWYLDKDAPDSARSSKIGFIIGAELSDVPK